MYIVGYGYMITTKASICVGREALCILDKTSEDSAFKTEL
jgi:hypothetical protein